MFLITRVIETKLKIIGTWLTKVNGKDNVCGNNSNDKEEDLNNENNVIIIML